MPQGGAGLRVFLASCFYCCTHMNEPALGPLRSEIGYSPGPSRMVSPVNPWSLKKSQVPDFTLTDAIWFCQPFSLSCACSVLA